MYQIHTGLQHGVIHPEQPYGLPTNIPLMSNRLIERGYVCHKVGKWCDRRQSRAALPCTTPPAEVNHMP
jgi:arylsulfatase A-like enzyme